MRQFYTFFIVCCFAFSSYAHENPKKILPAQRYDKAIKIDGILQEEGWQQSTIASDFIQNEPNVGKPASFETNVSVLYDDVAIYIGAVLYDPQPDKILKELSIRDNLSNADNFAVFFDPYDSGLHGFLFKLTAAGVQLDAIVSNHEEDYNWNAVWESEIQIYEDRWEIECKIPFSALRFGTESVQNWGLQFGREIRRFRETSYWNHIDPLVNGWVQQSGVLTEMKDIKTPVRLIFFPYVSGYIDHYSDPAAGISDARTAYNAGLDVKYGINDAFTLDMTVVPDFGQVISDRQVLNLSPFEIYFQENRQFFTEGTELFNKGNLFYSRRVGGRPVNSNVAFAELKEGESVVSNPENTTLYNATKLTGRNDKGYGFGLFNAIVGESHAIIRSIDGTERSVETNPLTNYNAVVVDKNLKNNSFISLMNTHVWRAGNTYDANATGLFFEMRNKKQSYGIGGDVSVTQKYSQGTNDAGYAYNVSAGKISGKWNYNINQGVQSVQYDPNDMGFLFNANQQYVSIEVRRQEFTPKRAKLQKWDYNLELRYGGLYNPNVYTEATLSLNNFYLWKSRDAIGTFFGLTPFATRDYFEPRTYDFVRFLASDPSVNVGGFFSSDYRKPVALDINTSTQIYSRGGRYNYWLSVAPRFRLSNKFSVFPNVALSYLVNEPGFTNKNFVRDVPLEIAEGDILMGIRNRLILDNTFTIRWIFTNKIGMNTRIRHYYDNVRYSSFGTLQSDGFIKIIDFDGQNSTGEYVFDRNINIFNIDLQLNWRFLPGSDMVFVWKNQIFNSRNREDIDYWANLGGLWNEAQTNSFSLRFLLYVDYLNVGQCV